MYLCLSNFSFLEICYVSVTLSRISINLQSVCVYIYTYIFLKELQRCILFVFLGTQNSWCWQLWPVTAMWPTVTSAASPTYKPGARIQLMTLGSWISGVTARIRQTCQISPLSFLDLTKAGLWWCFSEWDVSLYSCTISESFVMIPFQLTLGSYSKITSPSYVAISNGMSQSLLHLLTSHHACALSCFGCVRLSSTLWTVAQPAPVSMGFSIQDHWNGLLCPSPGDLPYPRIEPASLMSLALAGRFFTISATWEAP